MTLNMTDHIAFVEDRFRDTVPRTSLSFVFKPVGSLFDRFVPGLSELFVGIAPVVGGPTADTCVDTGRGDGLAIAQTVEKRRFLFWRAACAIGHGDSGADGAPVSGMSAKTKKAASRRPHWRKSTP
jgi:hypothetical protein